MAELTTSILIIIAMKKARRRIATKNPYGIFSIYTKSKRRSGKPTSSMIKIGQASSKFWNENTVRKKYEAKIQHAVINRYHAGNTGLNGSSKSYNVPIIQPITRM